VGRQIEGRLIAIDPIGDIVSEVSEHRKVSLLSVAEKREIFLSHATEKKRQTNA
jgi:hypothetical protein